MDFVIMAYNAETGEPICVATSIPKAIKYMVDHCWLENDTPTEDWEGRSLQERFGNNWQDVMEKMDIDKLNELFDDLWFGKTIFVK